LLLCGFVHSKASANSCLCVYMTTEQVKKQRGTIKVKNDLLVKYVDPDFGLLEKLESDDVFLAEVFEEIRAEKTKGHRIQKMLDHLRYAEESRYSRFLDALCDTNQAHVVNFIKGISDYVNM